MCKKTSPNDSQNTQMNWIKVLEYSPNILQVHYRTINARDEFFYFIYNISRRYYIRGGVRTIPACNAVRRGFLHIIDFSLCAVIVRSAFAVFTPRGFKRFRIDL